MDKQLIRNINKNKLINLKKDTKLKYEKIINKKLIDLLNDFNNIVLYYAFDYEINLNITINKLINTHNIYLPKIDNNNNLVFNKYIDINHLIKNKYNIYESTSNQYINYNNIDIIIVPLLAYDQYNNRIGKGKGYYDKVLSNIKYKVGIGLSILKYDTIDIENHDIKLDYIIDEL